jgi:PAS domain-containing protein
LPGALDNIGQYIVRKRAEDALRRNAARFRALIEHSSDMISLHRADATITYVSPSASRLVGYEPEALIWPESARRRSPRRPWRACRGDRRARKDSVDWTLPTVSPRRLLALDRRHRDQSAGGTGGDLDCG